MDDLNDRLARVEQNQAKLSQRVHELKSYFMARGFKRDKPIRYYKKAQQDLAWLRGKKNAITASLLSERKNGERIIRLTVAERHKLMRLIEFDFRQVWKLGIFQGRKSYTRRIGK